MRYVIAIGLTFVAAVLAVKGNWIDAGSEMVFVGVVLFCDIEITPRWRKKK